VACLLPHRDGRCREIRVGEVAYGNGDNSRKAFVLPVDSGAAGRTEIESQRVAAFGRPLPRRRFTAEGDLLAAEPRLVAGDGAGAALALQAMAHGDARWFALNREVKLPATTGGASGRHGVGSVSKAKRNRDTLNDPGGLAVPSRNRGDSGHGVTSLDWCC
jgi:hypothetical protein